MQKECASAAGGILHADGAVEGTDDFFGDAKAETEMLFGAAGCFRTVEPLENFGFFPVGDADAAVSHRNGIEIGAVKAGGSRLLWFGIGQGECDAASFRRIADGVVQKDGEELEEAFAVSEAGGHGGIRQQDTEADVFFVCQRFKGFVGVEQQRIRFHRFRTDLEIMGIRMGQEQHVVDEAPHPLPLGVYGGQESFRFFGGGFFCAVLSADGAGTGEDDRQRGAQFMGCGGNETDLFQPVFFHRNQ